jgi:hypothetical protein
LKLKFRAVSAHQSLLYFYLPRDPENIQVWVSQKSITKKLTIKNKNIVNKYQKTHKKNKNSTQIFLSDDVICPRRTKGSVQKGDGTRNVH